MSADYVSEMRRRRVAKKVEQAQRTAQRRAEERDRMEAERASRVSGAVAQTLKQRPTFPDEKSIYEAAYELDGFKDDIYFGDPTPSGVETRGFRRFAKLAHSDQLTQAMLAEAGVVIYATKEGAGLPDRETMESRHAREDRALERKVDEANALREREEIAFGVHFPKIQLRALTDGGQQ
jgi:hypothetical protein